MAQANLSSSFSVDTTKDSVVIVKVQATLPGGRTLDVTGFGDDEIQAGHTIIKETSSGEYKPMPTSGTLPAGHTREGVLIASIAVTKPLAAIMIDGVVNEAYLKYPASATDKTDLSPIKFINQ